MPTEFRGADACRRKSIHALAHTGSWTRHGAQCVWTPGIAYASSKSCGASALGVAIQTHSHRSASISALLLATGMVDTAEWRALLAEGVALLCVIRDGHLH